MKDDRVAVADLIHATDFGDPHATTLYVDVLKNVTRSIPIVVRIEGEIVGCVCLADVPKGGGRLRGVDVPGGALYIFGLAVAEPHRGKFIGSRLADAAVDMAVQWDRRVAVLYAMRPVRPMWVRRGFESVAGDVMNRVFDRLQPFEKPATRGRYKVGQSIIDLEFP